MNWILMHVYDVALNTVALVVFDGAVNGTDVIWTAGQPRRPPPEARTGVPSSRRVPFRL